VSIHLVGEVAASLDVWRTRWDPTMAARTPPHVTVVYPEETVDEVRLLRDLAAAADDIAPFDVHVGALLADDGGRGGVFAEVNDPTGALDDLRDRLLLPPQRYSGYPFHTTVAHPRTSPDPVGCWRALAGREVDATARVDELLFTVTDETGRRILERFPLRGDGVVRRTSYAGGVLVRDGRALLGFRSPERASYAGVWDVPGGHVEPGESPRAAVRRELREEIGVDVVLGGPWRRIVDDRHAAVLHLWRIDEWRGEVVNAAPDEHTELRWCSADEVRDLGFAHPALCDLVLDALAGGQSIAGADDLVRRSTDHLPCE
jgi:8-oxo-dGTP diphosphatase